MHHKFFNYLLKNQVIFALVVIVLAWFVFQIRGIIVSLFISYIIMAAMLPFVNFFQRKKFPKIAAVLVPYIGILLLVFALVFPLIKFSGGQIQMLLSGLPDYLRESATMLGFKINPDQVQSYVTRELDTIGRNTFSVTSKVFGGVFTTLTIIIVSFYLLMYHDQFKRWLAGFFHEEKRDRVRQTLVNVDERLGAWLRGQLVLCFAIGIMTWIALVALGIPNNIPLAVLAGFLEVIPTLGPLIASIPAIIVALTISPSLALIVALVYIVIQLLENNILVPKIMQRAVGLNPVLVILGVMIGANLMGVIGALLSLPFISFAIVLYKSFNNSNS